MLVCRNKLLFWRQTSTLNQVRKESRPLAHKYIRELMFQSIGQNEKRSNWDVLASLFTWDSYGKKAMLISLRVLIFLAASDLQISLNSSSGHTGQVQAWTHRNVNLCNIKFGMWGIKWWIKILRCIYRIMSNILV